MRKIFTITFTLFFLISCTGVKTVATGLESEAYLSFIGNPSKYKNELVVTVDEDTSFNAEVNKPYSKRPKGTVYAISTGKHLVSITYNNELIYNKQIFISTQETKKINLP